MQRTEPSKSHVTKKTSNVLCSGMGCVPDVAALQVSIVCPIHPTYRLRMSPFALAPARSIHLTQILSMRPTPSKGNRHGVRPCLLGRTCTAPSLLFSLLGPPSQPLLCCPVHRPGSCTGSNTNQMGASTHCRTCHVMVRRSPMGPRAIGGGQGLRP